MDLFGMGLCLIFVECYLCSHLVPWRSRVWQWWLLKSGSGLSFCLKVCFHTHTGAETHTPSPLLSKPCGHAFFSQLSCWSFLSMTGLVEQIDNFQTLSLRDFPASNLDPFLTIDEDYFYHTPHPRRPEVRVTTLTHSRHTLLCCGVHGGFSHYVFGVIL